MSTRLELGLRQRGDPPRLDASALGLGLGPGTLAEEGLIWLSGVSGMARRRSGERGRMFSTTARTLLLMGERTGRGRLGLLRASVLVDDCLTVDFET